MVSMEFDTALVKGHRNHEQASSSLALAQISYSCFELSLFYMNLAFIKHIIGAYNERGSESPRLPISNLPRN